jgi:hypothetical protein
MPRTTPLYGLPALSPSDRVRDLADIDWANAQKIEQILANEGQLPLGADLVSLIRRVNNLDSDTGWLPVSYRNSFTSGTGASSAPFQYRKVGNRVSFMGDVIRPNGTPTDRAAVTANLPVGFRPKSVLIQPIGLASWVADVQIDTDGTIGIQSSVGRTGGTGWPLGGVSFLVD